MKPIFFYSVICLLCIGLVSCESDDNETTTVTLNLHKVTSMQFSNGSGGEVLHSQTGLPIAEPFHQFDYDSQERLIKVSYPGGFGTFTHTYTYDDNSGRLTFVEACDMTGGLDQIYCRGINVFYDGNVIEYHNFDLSTNNVYGIDRYIYSDNSHRTLLQKEFFVQGEIDERFIYTYDSDGNMTVMDKYFRNQNDGIVYHTRRYEFTYDNMRNPFNSYANLYNSEVYGRLHFIYNYFWNYDFELPGRICPNNIVEFKVITMSSGNEVNRKFNYEYNADNYPVTRNFEDESGNIYDEISFEYY
ncbi:MAG: hypothetical protein HRT68_04290 [Flavobacteriaceae bacterium]|nr:hypothetical protein [Flavobacteriaceae bacterium]